MLAFYHKYVTNNAKENMYVFVFVDSSSNSSNRIFWISILRTKPTDLGCTSAGWVLDSAMVCGYSYG
jgi:hypothetical protein